MIIYSSTLDTEEKVKGLYGGISWSKIEGRFLLGRSKSYEIGSIGGEETHKLTVKEMPSHTHNYSQWRGADNVAYKAPPASYHIEGNTVDITTATGGNAAHNNMPPYKVVYIWERTE